MEQLQKAHAISGEIGNRMATMHDVKHDIANSNKQQFNDLARLRIERNKAARHARCTILRTK